MALIECTGSYNGGTNGGNGEGPSTPINDDIQAFGAPGHGTGENLSDYYMEHFSLSPGRGGEMKVYYGGLSIYGGGGGGVLVNGEGPTRPGCLQTAGEGYGGGGGGGENDCTHGLPGVVLIEVGP